MSETQHSKQVVDRLFNLYIIQTNRFLIQNTDGEYATGKTRLTSKMMLDHLEFKHTIGTFAGVAYSKFICFDVDYREKDLAKWITYKLAHELENVGVFDYYISYSGSKGYHVEIFIDDLIAIDAAKKFYEFIIRKLDISGLNGDIEFRATDKQGVKLPLGKHHKTGNYCGFCNIENGLQMMSKKESCNQLFLINKVKRQKNLDVLERIDDWRDILYNVPDKKPIIETENAISKHKDLDIYNLSESDIINDSIDLLTNGLKHPGTRHNSLIKVGCYLKYMGLDKHECIEALNEWMEKQDKNTYATKLNECYDDIKQIVKWTFEKDVSMKPMPKNIEITLEEINWIINSCPEKNQKLLVYSMLIHSKRYANIDGVFFMTYKQMGKVTELDISTVKRQTNKLIELNVIEAVERNRKKEKTYKKMPNKYKLNLSIEENNTNTNAYITNKLNGFDECLFNYYTDKELRKVLPRRQFNEFIKGKLAN